jgi:hypothetical protein
VPSKITLTPINGSPFALSLICPVILPVVPEKTCSEKIKMIKIVMITLGILKTQLLFKDDYNDFVLILEHPEMERIGAIEKDQSLMMIVLAPYL